MAKKRTKPKPATIKKPDDDAPGWNAIDAACERLYPDQPEPLHVASMPHPPIGDGLIYGISAYRATKPTHWHFVTYGFSELYTKESEDPNVSGWGFELTFRLVRGKEKQPPNWAFNFLMNLGKYVRRSGNPFGEWHSMDINGPIAWGTKTAIRAITFTVDPQLGTINTPNGRVQFLQVVGQTFDEHEACNDWHASDVLAIFREANLLLITDVNRQSMLKNKAIAARIQAGIDREGSQTGDVYVAVVEWQTAGRGKNATATVTLGAKGVQSLVPKLRSRLAHGRDFLLAGREQAVRFQIGRQTGWKKDAETLAITLTTEALAAVRKTLRPIRRRYTWPEMPGFTLVVQPSEITDPDGNVVEVIG